MYTRNTSLYTTMRCAMRKGIYLLRILIDENNNIWIFLSKHCFSELDANTIFYYLKIVIIVLDE